MSRFRNFLFLVLGAFCITCATPMQAASHVQELGHQMSMKSGSGTL